MIECPASIRNEATARHVELANRKYGYVCPRCCQRFPAELIELHMLVAHHAAFDERPLRPLP